MGMVPLRRSIASQMAWPPFQACPRGPDGESFIFEHDGNLMTHWRDGLDRPRSRVYLFLCEGAFIQRARQLQETLGPLDTGVETPMVNAHELRRPLTEIAHQLLELVAGVLRDISRKRTIGSIADSTHQVKGMGIPVVELLASLV